MQKTTFKRLLIFLTQLSEQSVIKGMGFYFVYCLDCDIERHVENWTDKLGHKFVAVQDAVDCKDMCKRNV